MKPHAVLFVVAVSALFITSCNSGAKQAKTYHDNMIHIAQSVIDSSLEYTDAIQSYDKLRALSVHKQYTLQVEGAIKQVEQMGDFKGDTLLKTFTLEMLNFYKTTLNKEFNAFISSVNSENSPNYSEPDMAVADSLILKLTSTESIYWDRFNWAEKRFYEKYEIVVAEK